MKSKRVRGTTPAAAAKRAGKVPVYPGHIEPPVMPGHHPPDTCQKCGHLFALHVREKESGRTFCTVCKAYDCGRQIEPRPEKRAATPPKPIALDLLTDWPKFMEMVKTRFSTSKQEFGDKSFNRDADKLYEDIQETLIDICSRLYVLSERLVNAQKAMKRYQALVDGAK